LAVSRSRARVLNLFHSMAALAVRGR
jgi:hypothetical protein